jgi:hypothetical protein
MPNMVWGWSDKPADKDIVIRCAPEGWRHIVSNLIDDLFTLGWNGTVFQVKEKFGGLRFYIGQGNNEIFARIEEASELSLQTCQDCGKPGVLRGGGWIQTLCDEHANGIEPIE